jgi:ankyrin repeat protein
MKLFRLLFTLSLALSLATLNIATTQAMVEKTPTEKLWTYASANDCTGIEQALKEGADIDAIHPGDGDTALHIAAQLGYSDVVDLLLAKGADSRIRNSGDKTPAEVARIIFENTQNELYNTIAKRLGRAARLRTLADCARATVAGGRWCLGCLDRLVQWTIGEVEKSAV